MAQIHRLESACDAFLQNCLPDDASGVEDQKKRDLVMFVAGVQYAYSQLAEQLQGLAAESMALVTAKQKEQLLSAHCQPGKKPRCP